MGPPSSKLSKMSIGHAAETDSNRLKHVNNQCKIRIGRAALTHPGHVDRGGRAACQLSIPKSSRAWRFSTAWLKCASCKTTLQYVFLNCNFHIGTNHENSSFWPLCDLMQHRKAPPTRSQVCLFMAFSALWSSICPGPVWFSRAYWKGPAHSKAMSASKLKLLVLELQQGGSHSTTNLGWLDQMWEDGWWDTEWEHWVQGNLLTANML